MGRPFIVALIIAAVALAAATTHGPQGAPAPSGNEVLRPFSPSSPFNTPIPRTADQDPRSPAVVAYLSSSGPPIADLDAYGVPVYEADSATPTVSVTCTMPWGLCRLQDRPVPIPAGARPAPGDDGAMVVVDRSTGTVYDFWQAHKTGTTTWTTSWGDVQPLDGDGRHGVTGADISRLAGVIRLAEIARGRIDHALVFSTTNNCASEYRYPAGKTDGSSTRSDCIPEGGRLRLDPTVDVDAIPGITPGERIVAHALQTYGAYAVDGGGAPMAIIFETPNGRPSPYAAAGLHWDYYELTNIPTQRLQLLAEEAPHRRSSEG